MLARFDRQFFSRILEFMEYLLPISEFQSPRIRLIIEILHEVLPLFACFLNKDDASQNYPDGLTIHIGTRAIQFGNEPGFDPTNLIQSWKYVAAALLLLQPTVPSDHIIEFDEIEEIKAKWLGGFEI